MKPAAPSPTNTEWPTVAIVGVGLIGGSIGLALQARRLAGRVIGIGRSAASLAAARRAKVVTETAVDLAAAAAEADLVVLRHHRIKLAFDFGGTGFWDVADFGELVAGLHG